MTVDTGVYDAIAAEPGRLRSEAGEIRRDLAQIRGAIIDLYDVNFRLIEAVTGHRIMSEQSACSMHPASRGSHLRLVAGGER